MELCDVKWFDEANGSRQSVNALLVMRNLRYSCCTIPSTRWHRSLGRHIGVCLCEQQGLLWGSEEWHHTRWSHSPSHSHPLSRAASAVFRRRAFSPAILFLPLSLRFNDTVRLLKLPILALFIKRASCSGTDSLVSQQDWHETPKKQPRGNVNGDCCELLGRALTSSERHRLAGSFCPTVSPEAGWRILAAERRLRRKSRMLCWTHTLNTGTFLSTNSARVNDPLRHWVLTALSLVCQVPESLSWRFVWDFFFFARCSK